jgi:hypothetical protein
LSAVLWGRGTRLISKGFLDEGKQLMAKIFNGIEGLPAPKYAQFKNTDSWLKACDRYVKVLKDTIRNSYKKECPEAGKMISFPVGDGKACYIVATLNPVQLIWIENGDNYCFEYAHRLTAADVRREINKAEMIKSLFAEKEKVS